ncbi:glycosyltransferase family 2 protein [Oenococcus oeni]|nr:glycosyltransferase family 2 protein [Oenococcus oeni]EJN92551.1 glycoside transferase family 2 [Oenococcus oeni AWRIB304]EJO01021.1 glycoside transferase family 2 [Oenococcus oeni AWRIB318]EJO08620.1 glycoside transferase family 2 [Oenococcus oeni AWRIB553]EJO10408.1 glycoside transferase family 2 [Oenococcus oeni AWRIB576]EJO10991.1 glycoside transferase family 2 [Oenococcus oeni AWRIB568]
MEISQHPSVDVVIPTYKRPKNRDQQNYMLRDALNSVLRQSYSVNEVFVVVDGRSEIARKIVADFHNDRIKIIESIEKKGGGSARNLGIRASQADFVAFLDDDDLWNENKIEKQLAALKNYSPNDLVFSFTQVKSEENDRYDLLPESGPKKDWSFAEYIFLHKGYMTTSTIMSSRGLLAKNMFTEKLPKHQDWDWLFKADFYCHAKSVYVGEPLTIYRTQYVGRSMSVSQRNTWHYSHEWMLGYRKYLSREVIASFDRGNVINGLLDDHSMNKLKKIWILRRILSDFPDQERKSEWKEHIFPFIIAQLKGRFHDEK